MRKWKPNKPRPGVYSQHALRVQDLVNEKLKMQQRDNELERLVHDLEMKVLNQESVRAEQEAQDSRWAHASHDCWCPKCRRRASRSRRRRFKMLESELELSLKKSLRIKEDKMAALEAHLQESSRLNQHLRQELSTVSPRIQ